MLNDPLAKVLNAVDTAEKLGKPEVRIGPSSKVITSVLQIIQAKNLLGEFELIENGRGGLYRIALTHKINRCGVIKPRFPVKVTEYELWEKKYLPAAGFGMLIVSTSQGMMAHREAKAKNLGGRLIAYVY